MQPRVAVVGAPSVVTDRLARLARGAGCDVHPCPPPAHGTSDVAVADVPNGATVIALVASQDATRALLALVPLLHRDHPGARLVVVGEGTDEFDAFFDVGVDIWIDRRADDDTVVAALVGPGWRARH